MCRCRERTSLAWGTTFSDDSYRTICELKTLCKRSLPEGTHVGAWAMALYIDHSRYVHYTCITLAILSHLSHVLLCISKREEGTNSSSERRGDNVNGGNNLKPPERGGNEFKLKRTFALKSRPESGLDSLCHDYSTVGNSTRRQVRYKSRCFWQGFRESRRCSRDTAPESYIAKYTSIRR